MKRVSVAILNWNGLELLKQFLPDVVRHSADLADICIIDNASTDESVAWIKTEFPTVQIIQNATNLGFAGGYNAGLESIENEFLVLLNSDVATTPNWIEPIISLFDEFPHLAACQPTIMDLNRPEWYEHAGAAGGFIDKDGFTFCKGRIFFEFEKQTNQYAANGEVFWASGAALFIRGELYKEVGGLDPDFFAHMEEIDLCWRLKNRGYSIGACRESEVFHLGGGTLQKVNPFKTFLNFRNNLYLLTKNCFHKPLFVVLLRRLLLDGLAALRFLTEGKLRDFFAVLRAHFTFYIRFGLMYKKRKSLKQNLKTPNLTGLYQRSILLDFFFKKQKTFRELDQSAFVDLKTLDRP